MRHLSLGMPTVPTVEPRDLKDLERELEEGLIKLRKEQAVYEEEQAKRLRASAEGQKKSANGLPENQKNDAVGAAVAILDLTLFADWTLF